MPEFTLTEPQAAAVNHLDGPCLVLAGAGTGKTRVITERIANLILNHKVAPSSIVALTFTDKAAGEMEARLDQVLPYGMFGTTISTFHSFCHEILCRHSYCIGVDANARLIGMAEAVSILRNQLTRLPLKHYQPPNNPVSFLRELVQFIDKAKEEQITPEALKQHAEAERKAAETPEDQEVADRGIELAECFAGANAIFTEANVLTYADLIANTLAILKTSAAARKEEQERIQYLLIDEFQDTNGAQAEIAYLLTNKQENIFVVGDDDQAIYRFRGANIGNILHFREHFKNAKIITLTDNFRSGQSILDVAYTLIQNNNPHRLEAIEKIDKRLKAHESFNEPVRHLHFSHSLYEQEGVVSTIESLLKQGIATNEIAILARGHAHLDGFEQELHARGIVTNRQKDGSFYEQPAIQQAVSYLRFLLKPHDSFNLFFLLSEAPFNLPLEQLREVQLAARKVNNSLWEQLALDDTPDFQTPKHYLQEQLTNPANKRATEALRLHIQQSNWEKQLLEANATSELSLLNTLYFEARSFESLHKPVILGQYIAHLDDLIASGEDIKVENEFQETGDGVQLLTIHASKGLEFRVVFVVNAVMDRFPGRGRSSGFPIPEELLSKEEDLVPYEEERRLAYVAFTRAKEQLYLTSSKRYAGNKRDKKLSVFLVEALGVAKEPDFADQALTTSLPVSQPGKKAIKLTPPTTYTASALEAFEDSPERYLHEFIYRLIQEESAYSSFGTTVHEVLRAHFAAKRSGENFDLESYYQSRWNSIGYENRETEARWKADGLVAIQKYLEKHTEAAPDRLEVPVELGLPNGVRIIGKVDRIDRNPDGTLHIIDYKTGRSEKPASPKDNLPLALYAAALTQKGEKVAQVSLHYLMTEQELSLPITDSYLEKATLRAGEIVAAIQEAHITNTFPATTKYFR